ncbi:hypothetical protein ACOMHN_011548 [Nucella lapillus]
MPGGNPRRLWLTRDVHCQKYPSRAAPAATAGYVTALKPVRCTCNRGENGAKTEVKTTTHCEADDFSR